MIYVIQSNYICPDQATIDEGKSLYYIGQFSIGTEVDAQALLTQLQNNCLTKNINLFTANLEVIVSDGVQWTLIDLNTEPENTDRIYQIFDPINGNYEQTIGLDNAKALLAEEQQSYLAFNFLANYRSCPTWNDVTPHPAKPDIGTTGTQTL